MNTTVPSSGDSELIELAAQLDSLPPHDPNRFETLDGYDNPSCTNGKRAGFTIEALAVFEKACHMQEETDVAAGDLIGDLLHLVHSQGHDPKGVLKAALTNFIAEAG